MGELSAPNSPLMQNDVNDRNNILKAQRDHLLAALASNSCPPPPPLPCLPPPITQWPLGLSTASLMSACKRADQKAVLGFVVRVQAHLLQSQCHLSLELANLVHIRLSGFRIQTLGFELTCCRATVISALSWQIWVQGLVSRV